MKVRELLEWPVHLDGTYTPHVKTDSYPSLAGLRRERIFLGTLTVDDVEFHFWASNRYDLNLITTEATDPVTKETRQWVVLQLKMHSNEHIPTPNPLQVDGVWVRKEYRNKFLAGAMYVLLARYGYSVISDTYQYTPGKMLWKKLGKEAKARSYVVKLWDDKNREWIKDKDGKIIQYDSKNIKDSKIWQNSEQFSKEGKTVLFVLTSK